MSRSYKKNPIIKDNGKGKKDMKAIANRAVRRKLNDPEYEIADGKAYKKEFESWNIADYVARWTKEEAIAEYDKRCVEEDGFRKEWPTLESWLNFWEKCMRRK